MGEDKVWQALGTFAVAREDLSENVLREMDLWEDSMTGRVLRLAASFFAPRPLLPVPGPPYRFDHPGYQREVITHISEPTLRGIHGRLAEGCLRVLLGQAPANMQRYASHHLAHHYAADPLLEAQPLSGLGGEVLNSGPLLDMNASCNLCGSRGIAHGLLRAGSHGTWEEGNPPMHDCYRTALFFSFCPACYWFYCQYFETGGSQGRELCRAQDFHEMTRFDYRTNVYLWKHGGELEGIATRRRRIQR
jgi:hypothetical protein